MNVEQGLLLFLCKNFVYRPPGHHAMAEEFSGYCYFNNIAITTHIALKKYNLERLVLQNKCSNFLFGNFNSDQFFQSQPLFLCIYTHSHMHICKDICIDHLLEIIVVHVKKIIDDLWFSKETLVLRFWAEQCEGLLLFQNSDCWLGCTSWPRNSICFLWWPKVSCAYI